MAQLIPEPAGQDGTQTYGAQVAQRLNADYQIIAYAGAQQNPLANGQSLNNRTLVPRLLTELVAANDTMMVDPSNWIPQTIILAGGTNDFLLGAPPVSPDEWALLYLQFIEQASRHHSSAPGSPFAKQISQQLPFCKQTQLTVTP